MKHNIFKRIFAAGLAVMCVAAYAPTVGDVELFDTAIVASAGVPGDNSGGIGGSGIEIDKPITVVGPWTSGDCTVTLDGSGTLNVSGNGAMADYMQYDAPWKDYSYYIKSVIVEDGVTHIGDQSFYECENLETITVNSNLASTGYQFAYSCNNLKTVTFNGNVEDFDDIFSCEKLESVTFNGNVGTIKAFGFDSNSSLKNVTFNGSVERFNYNAFVYCPSLETVTLTPQANGTLYIEEDVTDNTTAKIKYANTSGYLYDGDTKIEDESLISDLQGKTLTWKADTILKTGTTYKQKAQANGKYYTRFVFVKTKDEIAGKNKVKFTATCGDKTGTFETEYYYTAVMTGGVKYVPDSEDSVLLVVTVTSSTDISAELKCTCELQ